MSIKVMTWYWDNSKQEGHKLLLLLALADWSDDEGECYPSTKRIAQRIRRQRRSTQRAIKELEDDGELLIHQGMGKGPDGQRSSLIYLLKYRAASALEIPPIIIEAAQHYRSKSRKQGKKAAEVRKAQAALLDESQGAHPTTPPTGAADDTPTGAADDTPTGAADDTQIRHIDPSVEPSAPVGRALHAHANAIANNESFDGPQKPTPKTTRRRKATKTHKHYDPRKLVDGYIPPGQGTTAVEIYYERFSPADHRLTAPNQDDIVKVATNLDKWRSVVIAWSQTPYRPNNIKGMFDWYRGGIPVHQNGNGAGPTNSVAAYAEKERKQYEQDFGPDRELTPEQEQWFWDQKRQIEERNRRV